jgi:hypothetical protein
MDGTEVGVLEKSNEIGLGRFLKGEHGRALEAKVSLKVLCNFTYKTLEGDYTKQQTVKLFWNDTVGET